MPLFFIIGLLFLTLAGFMFFPLCFEFYYASDNWFAFAITIFFASFFGVSLILATSRPKFAQIRKRQIFLLTVISWILISFLSALPFIFAKITSPFNCWFLAISALSTTSFMLKVINFTPGLELWFCILNWLGGIGVVVLALALFPMLKLTDINVLRSDFSDQSEKVYSKISEIGKMIFKTYLVLSVLAFVIFNICGLPIFKALCHALSVISTGGIHYLNMQQNSLWIWTVVFMIFGGGPIVTYARLLYGEYKIIFSDQQLKGYMIFLVCGISLLLLNMHMPFTKKTYMFGITNAVAAITSTGVVSDYNNLLIFIFSLVGGCAGSTAGGIKIMRWQILLGITRRNLKQLISPYTVSIAKYQKEPIKNEIAQSISVFFFLYISCWMIFSLLLSFQGLSNMQGLFLSLAALSNSGITDVNLDLLSTNAKLSLMLAMIMGRLELVTVLVLFMPNFWRD